MQFLDISVENHRPEDAGSIFAAYVSRKAIRCKQRPSGSAEHKSGQSLRALTDDHLPVVSHCHICQVMKVLNGSYRPTSCIPDSLANLSYHSRHENEGPQMEVCRFHSINTD